MCKIPPTQKKNQLKVKVLVTQPCPTLCNPWTVAHQASLSMEFFRQEYWSGYPFPSPGDLPGPGIKPKSLALPADFLSSEPSGKHFFSILGCSTFNVVERFKPPLSSVQFSHSVVSDSLRPHGLSPTRLLCPWDFPGNSTGVDCHFRLQRIFPTQGSNLGLPHCKQILYRLSHQVSPQRSDPLLM